MDYRHDPVIDVEGGGPMTESVDLKQIDPEQFQTVLEEHLQWLRTEGQAGRKADLSNADLRQAELSRVDLRQADLRGADLRGASFATEFQSQGDRPGVNLSQADLREANLAEAYLIDVDLSGANLAQANLSGAHLTKANLGEADLSGANLSDADLISADLSGAQLNGADLSGAYLIHANLSGANLSGAKIEEADLDQTKLDEAQLRQLEGSEAAEPQGVPEPEEATPEEAAPEAREPEESQPEADTGRADTFRSLAGIVRPLAPQQDLLERYHLMQELGRGEVGAVWLALDMQRGSQLVTLKALPVELCEHTQVINMLIEKTKPVMRLNHRGIMRLINFEQDDGLRFFVMENLAGPTLSEVFDYRYWQCKKEGDPVIYGKEFVGLITQLCEALSFAHRQGVLHLALRPRNVMFEERMENMLTPIDFKQQTMKICDFTLARSLEEWLMQLTGAPAAESLLYQAPEQFEGATPGPATDIYSLGCLLYESLSGQPPFVGEDIAARHLQEQPKPVQGLKEKVWNVLECCLAKRPEDRFASCDELLEQLLGKRPRPAEARPPAAAQTSTAAPRVPSPSEPPTAKAEPKQAVTTQPSEPQVAPAPSAPKTRDAQHDYVETHSGLNVKMLWIPEGAFQMGMDVDYYEEQPLHEVEIDGFWMAATPVMQAQYEAIMGQNPSANKGPQHPAEKLSWNDANEFCNRLARATGRHYTLPTEAQWEYACRAGNAARWCFGDDEDLLDQYAWHFDNAGKTTHPVAQKKPNPWGLFDTHGNVWEWCRDWFDEYFYSHTPRRNPQGPVSGSMRVLRGGSWDSDIGSTRSARRFRFNPKLANNLFGFRICRIPSRD